MEISPELAPLIMRDNSDWERSLSIEVNIDSGRTIAVASIDTASIGFLPSSLSMLCNSWNNRRIWSSLLGIEAKDIWFAVERKDMTFSRDKVPSGSTGGSTGMKTYQ